MKINRKILVGLFFCFSFFLGDTIFAADLAGRILLQVEAHGEAWYVEPVSSKRYYLGRPHDAFALMQNLGLGVKTGELKNFLATQAPRRLSGKILLQVEDKGQAYYVNPLDLKLYYLGRPADALALMRQLGLGISNADLENIALAPYSALPLTTFADINSIDEIKVNENLVEKIFSFKYLNEINTFSLTLSPDLYQSYQSAPKVLTYAVNNPPTSLEEAFYDIFLNVKEGDDSIDKIVAALQEIAYKNKLGADGLAELALAFVQYIPYDYDKAEQSDISLYYPYETLFLNKGICSDKTLLAFQIIKKLGFGVAIMNFPDINHSALGLACENKYSINNSGYCYVETTNYFPPGVIPQNISNGQALTSTYDFSNLFSTANLGEIKILKKTAGKLYLGEALVRDKAAYLNSLYQKLASPPDTNSASYFEIISYNKKVEEFNSLLKEFYQQ
ncbi:MAG: hypothetical protein PWQ35_79 [Patescibacteria group bacterium]|nr:hypothetical protein [Patescibacteria group bacterium]